MSLWFRSLVCSFRYGAGIALVLLFGLLTALGSTAAPGRAGEPAAPRYLVTDLGLIEGSSFTPNDINESGVIVGAAGHRGAIWTPDTPNGLTGTGFRIGVVAGFDLTLFKALNDAGVAVGHSEPNIRVGIVRKDGVNTILHSPPNTTLGEAYDVNSEGKIVGYSYGQGITGGATVWVNNVPTYLPSLPSGSGGFAFSINDNDTIVGSSKIMGASDDRAVKWIGGECFDLQGGTSIAAATSGKATAINNLGHIVGTAFPPGSPQRGYLWITDTPVELGNLGLTGGGCVPDDINDSDQIVGHIDVGGTYYPFLYENGTMVNLNTLVDPNQGFHITTALGINNAGQIVGTANSGTAVLLTPFTAITADIETTLTATPSPALVGRELKYTGTVKNKGPQDASRTQAIFTLPEGVDLVSATPAPIGQVAEDLIFELGPLVNQQVASLEVVVRPTAPGTLRARLQGDAPERDPNRDNNFAPRNVNAVAPVADLAVTFPAPPSPAFVGQNLTYAGTVKNAGPQSATEAKAVFTLPAGVDLVSTTPSATRDGNELTFDLGTMADEQVVNWQVVVKPTLAGTLTARMQASALETEPTPGNNSVTRNVTTRSLSADLSVTGTAAPNSLTVGDTVTYRFTIKNLGPDPAENVRWAMSLALKGPDELIFIRFLTMEASRGTTFRDGDNIFADLGTLNKNETALVTVTAMAVAPTNGPLQRGGFAVQVGAPVERDPNHDNNAASPPITIRAVSRPNLFGHWDLLQVKKKGKGKKLKYLVDAVAMITNDGNAGAGASKLRFFLSTDRTRSKDDAPLTVKVNGQELPVEIPVDALAAGASKAIIVTQIKVSKKDYLAKLKGKFLLGVVDFAGTVPESDETDNVFPKKGDKVNPF